MRFILYDLLFPSADRRRGVALERLPERVRDKLEGKTKAAKERERWLVRLQRVLGRDIDQSMEEFVEASKVRREDK